MIDLITPINILKESLEKVQLNEQNTAIYERLKMLISILENRINGVGIMICNPTYLNHIATFLSNIQSHVTNDIANPTAGYYTNISTQIDNIISQLIYIPALDKMDYKQSLNQIVGNYKKQNRNIIDKMIQEKDNFEHEILSLTQKINALEIQVKNKETELTSLVEDFKRRFENAQNLRDATSRTKLDNTLRLWDEAGQRYSEQIKNNEEQIQKRFDEKCEDLKQQTESIINYMKERQEEIKKIYGLIGDIVSCGEYKRYGDEEGKTANKMFWTSFGLFCSAAAVMIVATICELFNEGEFSWWSVLTRLPVAVVILLPAFYTAIEARKRRNQEIALRDFEIKIANIDPYLKNIDFVETEREKLGQPLPEGVKTARELKIELAKEFFSAKQVKDTDNIVIPKDMIELFEKIMSFCDRKDK